MIEALGIEMAAGRTYSKEFSTDSAKIIFNGPLFQRWDSRIPVGKVINRWGTDVELWA